MIGEKESSEDLPKAYFITTCTRDNRLDDSICVQEIINDLDISKMNSLNPEKSLKSANSPFAMGRPGEIEIRKFKSRITELSENMGKKFILFKKEIQMREELPIPGFENSLNSEKFLISANSLNPLNSEKSLNSANSPIAAATGRACPARSKGGRGFRFRAGERKIRKFKSRIIKFPEKKSKNFFSTCITV